MNILMFSTYDRAGGAEKVALDLQRSYRGLGHDARLFVRYRRSNKDAILEIDPYEGTKPWASICRLLEAQVRRAPVVRGRYRILDLLRQLALPSRGLDAWRGIDNYRNPSIHTILDSDLDWHPDVIHAHNLHGDYFDLSALPELSRKVPFVWTLHDTWAFTGHCGYFMECERWTHGCGHCPDLKRPPTIRRDATAKNWENKRQVYALSRLAVATPSRWLMSHLDSSILQEKEKKIIPNGVDLEIFKPGDKQSARQALDLPERAFICLYVSYYGAQTNPYKDYTTITRTLKLLTAENLDLFFVCIGGSAQLNRQPHSLETGFIDDPATLALYYQASDVLLHAANAENFPCVILEAMASGAVVVATAVGGIPEQIEDGKTGFTVPPKDADRMASRVLMLMQNPIVLEQISQEAIRVSQDHYSLDLQSTRYLEWFHNLVESHRYANF